MEFDGIYYLGSKGQREGFSLVRVFRFKHLGGSASLTAALLIKAEIFHLCSNLQTRRSRPAAKCHLITSQNNTAQQCSDVSIKDKI